MYFSSKTLSIRASLCGPLILSLINQVPLYILSTNSSQYFYFSKILTIFLFFCLCPTLDISKFNISRYLSRSAVDKGEPYPYLVALTVLSAWSCAHKNKTSPYVIIPFVRRHSLPGPGDFARGICAKWQRAHMDGNCQEALWDALELRPGQWEKCRV